MDASHPTDEEIRARAYDFYLERGGCSGHDIDEWLQAEYELIHLPVRKIAEVKPPPSGDGKAGKRLLVDLVHAAVGGMNKSLSHSRWRDAPVENSVAWCSLHCGRSPRRFFATRERGRDE